METEYILKLKDLYKRFPGTIAVDHVNLSIKQGEIHAIVGENGAGKSTLIKMLSGATTPTSGSITFEGREYKSLIPSQAIDNGISVIYQEFNLVPGLSIAANIFLGREFGGRFFLSDHKAELDAQKLLDEWQVNLNPKVEVKNLSIAEQQIVEVIKAISHDVKLLIMDEPTASLTLDEVNTLFKLTKQLKAKGVTIIYISHRLEEIFEICDRASVLRDGCFITTLNVQETSMAELIRHMVGRELAEYPKVQTVQSEVLMSVHDLSDGKVFKNVSFDLHKGEVLGIYALIGAGRTDVALTLFGAKHRRSGSVRIHGKQVEIFSPSGAVRHGLGLVPEDRKGQGLVLSMRSSENITLSSIEGLARGSFIQLGKEAELVHSYQDKLKMQAHVTRTMARNLSGGTQQKIVLAKVLASNAEVILFDEPTRGIDVGAKHEIYELMSKLCQEGKGILMISSEMPELLGMADRILVMRAGRIVGEFLRSEATEEKLLSLAAGQGTTPN